MNVSTMFVQTTSEAVSAVMRGYRLHVTNLEDRDFTYTASYWVTPPDDKARWAALLNHLFILRSPGYESPFHRVGSVYVASSTFVVAAKHTVSVQFRPGSYLSNEENIPVLEGHVTIELPVLKNTQGESFFRSAPQSDRPVKVLLNPETIMIHTDIGGSGYTQSMDGIVTGKVSRTPLTFDTVEPIIPASGKAENELTPSGIRLLSREALADTLKVSKAAGFGMYLGAQHLPDSERMGALLELLCELDGREAFLTELNKVLAKNRAAVKISRQKS
jgi:hypothetical protein